MSGIRRRATVAALAMCGASGLAMALRPRRMLSDVVGMPHLATLFPPRFGRWRVEAGLPVVLPVPDVQAKLHATYGQVLSRTYVDDRGEHVMLSVAYGGDQADGTRAHRPEVCYPAQGYRIVDERAGTLSVAGRTLEVRQLMAQLGPRNEPITYWIVVGGQVVASGAGQKVVELRYGLRGLIPDGLLVRVSTIDFDMARGLATQERFVADLAAALSDAGRARVFGERTDRASR